MARQDVYTDKLIMEKINSKELAPIKGRQTKMEKVVNELSITNDSELAFATKALSGIKSFLKEVTAKEKEITKPLNEALKNARALFAPFKDSAKEAETLVKKKMIVYQNELEKKRREAEEKEAAKVEKGSIKPETAVRHLEEVAKPETHVKEGSASVTFKKVKDFEVEDVSKLPVEYLLANEVAIRKAMREGVELEGVRYFEKDVISAK